MVFLRRLKYYWIFLCRINKSTDRLLVVSNGFDGDKIAKKAHDMGIQTE